MEVNGGKIEKWAYGEKKKGRPDRWAWDTDGDGKVDQRAYDTDGDGKPERWEWFDKSGQTTSRSYDTNDDGKAEGGKIAGTALEYVQMHQGPGQGCCHRGSSPKHRATEASFGPREMSF